MSCESVLRAIPLYWYGELAPAEEELVEEHVAACAACNRELDRQKTLCRALDGLNFEPPAGLLESCRRDLLWAVEEAVVERERRRASWLGLGRLAEWLPSLPSLRVPAGALALVALGFFAARFSGTAERNPLRMSLAPEAFFASVRWVQPDGVGRVRIAVDETRRRTIVGDIEDRNVQRLLLAAARDERNAGLRVESMDLLKDHTTSPDVRDLLLEALVRDSNAGVRLKALEGLKPFAAEANARKALIQVLFSDQNPAVRIHAIDLLMEHRDQDMVGVWQNLVDREQNPYVRLKCVNALREMNASAGTF